MSEDLTQNLPPRSFEERVLTELAAMRQENTARFDSLETSVTSLGDWATALEGRMTSLEEKVDARLRETRPLWESVHQRLTAIEKELGSLHRYLKSFAGELGLLRVRVDHLEDEVEGLKQGRS
jgi:predicted nuclease with TOPRIM domain